MPLLFNNYRNTSCVSSSFFLTLFVSSVCWWTDFTEELIEKMPRAILSENSSRIFHEVHATVMTFWYITITASSTKTTLLKDDIYHWHLSGTKRTIQKDFSIQGTVREHTSCGLNILICFVASKHKFMKISCQCSLFIHKKSLRWITSLPNVNCDHVHCVYINLNSGLMVKRLNHRFPFFGAALIVNKSRLDVWCEAVWGSSSV